MQFVVPNSGGLPEPEQAPLTSPLIEKWSDEARVASAAVRRARSKYKTDDDKKKRNRQKEPTTRPTIDDATVKQVGGRVKARTAGEHAARRAADDSYQRIHADKEKAKADEVKAKAAADKKAAGSGKGKGDDSPKAEGETKNAKGERVIKYSDGSTVTVHGKTATHTKADGSSATGKYRDPAPAGSKEKRPKGFTADTPESKERAAESARKKAETERRKAARAKARPVKQKVLRVKLSRTRRGPRAA